MFTFPTVTEIRVPLEPCTPDTFIAGLSPAVGAAAPAPASGSNGRGRA